MSQGSQPSTFENLEHRRLFAGYALVDLAPFIGTGGAGIEDSIDNSPDVNDAGTVAGLGFSPNGLHRHATLRLPGKKGRFAFLNVGNFKVDEQSQAKGINNFNATVGSYDTGATPHAYIADLGRKGRVVLTPLGDVKGESGSTAFDVNDSRVVVGSVGGHGSNESAAVWLPGKRGAFAVVPLPELGKASPIPGLGLASIAHSVNEAGVAVGMSQNEGLLARAAMWTPGKGGRYAVTDLGALGAFQSSYAHAINDNGIVVGQSVGEDIKKHAVFWAPGRKGRYSLAELPTLAGATGSDGSIAKAVNNADQIVGYADFADDRHAVLWERGRKGYVAVDLHTYLPKGSKWELHEATSISDTGIIVGTGVNEGGTATWMLVPSKGKAGFTFVAQGQPAAAAAAAPVAPQQPKAAAQQSTGCFSTAAITGQTDTDTTADAVWA